MVRIQSYDASVDQPFNQNHNMFFVYNPNGIEEVVQQLDNSSSLITEVDSNTYFAYRPQDYIDFYSYDSILPGDTVNLSLPLSTGAGNWTGQWTVTGFVPPQLISVTGGSSITGTSTYNVVAITPSNTTTTPPVLPGVTIPPYPASIPVPNATYIQANSPSPLTLYKRILNIAPNPNNLTTLTDVVLDTSNLWDRVSINAGFEMTSLDKINFTTAFTQGLDAYKIATGLIASANQVVYGVPNNKVIYPGIAAAEADVVIEAAIVKTIYISIGVRLSVPNTQMVFNNIQSAIAALINSTPVGISISLSQILTSAQGIQGVTSAVMITPVLNTSNDLIKVQPFEKPLVTDLNSQIQVSLL